MDAVSVLPKNTSDKQLEALLITQSFAELVKWLDKNVAVQNSFEVWQYRYYYHKLPERYFAKYPNLCIAMSYLHLFIADLEGARYYQQQLHILNCKANPSSKKYLQSQGELTYLTLLMLHHKRLSTIKSLLKNTNMTILLDLLANINSNRPSVLNGLNDFTAFFRLLLKYPEQTKSFFSDAFGADGLMIYQVAIAEALYQKNRCYEALVILVATIPMINPGKNINLWFTAVYLQLCIMVVTKQFSTVHTMVEVLKETALSANAEYLLPNIKALTIWAAMYDCEHKKIISWLADDAPNDYSELCLLNCFACFVKLRIYIMYNKHMAFLALAKRLQSFLETLGRQMDLCELNMLIAISYHTQGKKELAFELIYTVMQTAQRYGYDRLLGDEGERLYYLLNDYKEARGGNSYVDYIVTLCRQTALYYPDYMHHLNKHINPLTESELDVLRLMAAERTNAEIGKFLSITVNTVKYHSKNIFSKLNVANRRQAVKLAKALWLI